jgi:imidazolonepropionase-like amidohydrolase
VIDVGARTILPGFVNAHVHRAFEAENLAAWAQAGVTTVRDVGARPVSPASWDEWMAAGDAGGDLPRLKIFNDRDTTLNRPEYARIVAAGPIVTVPRGYPIPAWGKEVALTVTSPEDAGHRTALLLDASADLVKISLERGPRLSPEEVAAIVAAAHERDTLVTAHVSAAKRLAVGVEAGINDAAHMVTDRLPDELIDEMVARDVYVVPTLAVLEAYGDLGEGIENVRRFVAAGGKVALGDDYGNPGIELGMPVREMELMEKAGMTPMQIIVAGTGHSAQVSNLGDELGTLEMGKIADVLVVEGDPLQDIHALTNVWLVIKDGVVIRLPLDY